MDYQNLTGEHSIEPGVGMDNITERLTEGEDQGEKKVGFINTLAAKILGLTEKLGTTDVKGHPNIVARREIIKDAVHTGEKIKPPILDSIIGLLSFIPKVALYLEKRKIKQDEKKIEQELSIGRDLTKIIDQLVEPTSSQKLDLNELTEQLSNVEKRLEKGSLSKLPTQVKLDDAKERLEKLKLEEKVRNRPEEATIEEKKDVLLSKMNLLLKCKQSPEKSATLVRAPALKKELEALQANITKLEQSKTDEFLKNISKKLDTLDGFLNEHAETLKTIYNQDIEYKVLAQKLSTEDKEVEELEVAKEAIEKAFEQPIDMDKLTSLIKSLDRSAELDKNNPNYLLIKSIVNQAKRDWVSALTYPGISLLTLTKIVDQLNDPISENVDVKVLEEQLNLIEQQLESKDPLKYIPIQAKVDDAKERLEKMNLEQKVKNDPSSTDLEKKEVLLDKMNLLLRCFEKSPPPKKELVEHLKENIRKLEQSSQLEATDFNRTLSSLNKTLNRYEGAVKAIYNDDIEFKILEKKMAVEDEFLAVEDEVITTPAGLSGPELDQLETTLNWGHMSTEDGASHNVMVIKEAEVNAATSTKVEKEIPLGFEGLKSTIKSFIEDIKSNVKLNLQEQKYFSDKALAIEKLISPSSKNFESVNKKFLSLRKQLNIRLNQPDQMSYSEILDQEISNYLISLDFNSITPQQLEEKLEGYKSALEQFDEKIIREKNNSLIDDLTRMIDEISIDKKSEFLAALKPLNEISAKLTFLASIKEFVSVEKATAENLKSGIADLKVIKEELLKTGSKETKEFIENYIKDYEATAEKWQLLVYRMDNKLRRLTYQNINKQALTLMSFLESTEYKEPLSVMIKVSLSYTKMHKIIEGLNKVGRFEQFTMKQPSRIEDLIENLATTFQRPARVPLTLKESLSNAKKMNDGQLMSLLNYQIQKFAKVLIDEFEVPSTIQGMNEFVDSYSKTKDLDTKEKRTLGDLAEKVYEYKEVDREFRVAADRLIPIIERERAKKVKEIIFMEQPLLEKEIAEAKRGIKELERIDSSKFKKRIKGLNKLIKNGEKLLGKEITPLSEVIGNKTESKKVKEWKDNCVSALYKPSYLGLAVPQFRKSTDEIRELIKTGNYSELAGLSSALTDVYSEFNKPPRNSDEKEFLDIFYQLRDDVISQLSDFPQTQKIEGGEKSKPFEIVSGKLVPTENSYGSIDQFIDIIADGNLAFEKTLLFSWLWLNIPVEDMVGKLREKIENDLTPDYEKNNLKQFLITLAEDKNNLLNLKIIPEIKAAADKFNKAAGFGELLNFLLDHKVKELSIVTRTHNSNAMVKFNLDDVIALKKDSRSDYKKTVKDFAEALTQMDTRLFTNWRQGELTNKNWEQSPLPTPTHSQLTSGIEQIKQYVQSEILKGDSADKELVGQKIKFFTDVIEQLEKSHDYAGAIQLHASLFGGANISRVGKAIFSSYSEFNPDIKKSPNDRFEIGGKINHLLEHNYKELRSHLKSDADSIPYTGLFTGDLTFIDDGNPSTSKDDKSKYNLNKAYLFAKVEGEVSELQQNLKQHGKLKPVGSDSDLQEGIISTVLTVPKKDDDYWYQQSLKLFPRE